MKRILLAVALVAGTWALAGSVTAAAAPPKAYPGGDALTALPHTSPSHSPRLTEVPRGSRGPRVVLNGAHLVAGPVHARPVHTSAAGTWTRQSRWWRGA